MYCPCFLLLGDKDKYSHIMGIQRYRFKHLLCHVLLGCSAHQELFCKGVSISDFFFLNSRILCKKHVNVFLLQLSESYRMYPFPYSFSKVILTKIIFFATQWKYRSGFFECNFPFHEFPLFYLIYLIKRYGFQLLLQTICRKTINKHTEHTKTSGK